MKASKTPKGGVQGRTEFLPCQGAHLSLETNEQSCPTKSCPTKSSPTKSRGTTQLRMRLPTRHAERWLALPSQVREHAATALFGLGIDGVDLQELATMTSELRAARVAITSALQLSMVKGAALDVRRVESALGRINQILGGRQL